MEPLVAEGTERAKTHQLIRAHFLDISERESIFEHYRLHEMAALETNYVVSGPFVINVMDFLMMFKRSLCC